MRLTLTGDFSLAALTKPLRPNYPGDYDGLLVNASPGVNFQAYEHFGIGLNYNYFELDVSVDKSNWRGDIETTYDGIYVYASVYY